MNTVKHFVKILIHHGSDWLNQLNPCHDQEKSVGYPIIPNVCMSLTCDWNEYCYHREVPLAQCLAVVTSRVEHVMLVAAGLPHWVLPCAGCHTIVLGAISSLCLSQCQNLSRFILSVGTHSTSW